MSQAMTLARPYARAAFSLARDGGSLAGWSDALGFAARVAADPQVAALLGHPGLTAADAIGLLAPPAATVDVETFARFIGMLLENRRLSLLPEISGLFDELRFEAERVVKARITSATELPAAELETIKVALRKRFGRDVDVETAVDADLIGGAVIDAGDVVIDGSLRGQLGRLQAALLN